MHCALIDLGSNSIRLCVYEYDKDHIERLLNEKRVAGLAGYVSEGVLDDMGIARACCILEQFKKLAIRFVPMQEIYVFATASLRNIKNREQAAAIIVHRVGLQIQILEGEEEAVLSFAGAMYRAQCDTGVMVDIGGGSTELVRFADRTALHTASMPVGCLNLYMQYTTGAFPQKGALRQISEAVQGQLARLRWQDGNEAIMVGVGGTARAALKLAGEVFDLYDTDTLCAGQIQALTEIVRQGKPEVFKAIYRTIPERALTITTGLIILDETIRHFGCQTIKISRFGVREGYLLQRIIG
ncbi:MAG: phosphatase [Oscillospiraceae bacterium]|nr:phosphatase [Oscillospiraceae bacterium]